VDEGLLSEGYHEVGTGPSAELSIGTYSGHLGHGDVAWVDYAHVRRIAEETMESAREAGP
jgi:hypothetical protein